MTRSERGSSAIEFAILLPALMLMLGLMATGGRIWFARGAVVDAAGSAARSASIARSSSAAQADGRAAVDRSLATAGLRCQDQSVSINTAGFAAPVGTPASIGASVSCRVPLADVSFGLLPGSISVSADGSSALDTYRERS